MCGLITLVRARLRVGGVPEVIYAVVFSFAPLELVLLLLSTHGLRPSAKTKGKLWSYMLAPLHGTGTPPLRG